MQKRKIASIIAAAALLLTTGHAALASNDGIFNEDAMKMDMEKVHAVVFKTADINHHFDGVVYSDTLKGAVFIDEDQSAYVTHRYAYDNQQKYGIPVEGMSDYTFLKCSEKSFQELSKAEYKKGITYTAKELSDPERVIDIKLADDEVKVINVDAGLDFTWAAKVTVNGKEISSKDVAGRILWNLCSFDNVVTVKSPYLVGCVLAPVGEVELDGCEIFKGSVISYAFKSNDTFLGADFRYDLLEGWEGVATPTVPPTVAPTPTIDPTEKPVPTETAIPTPVPSPENEPVHVGLPFTYEVGEVIAETTNVLTYQVTLTNTSGYDLTNWKFYITNVKANKYNTAGIKKDPSNTLDFNTISNTFDGSATSKFTAYHASNVLKNGESIILQVRQSKNTQDENHVLFDQIEFTAANQIPAQ